MPRTSAGKLNYCESRSGGRTRRRWRIRYRGKTHYFERRPNETKLESFRRCSREWEARKVEIDARENPQTIRDQVTDVLASMLGVAAGTEDTCLYAEVEETRRLLDLAEARGTELPVADDGSIINQPATSCCYEAPSDAVVRIAREKLSSYHSDLRQALRARLTDPAPLWHDVPRPVVLDSPTLLIELIDRYTESNRKANKQHLSRFAEWLDPRDELTAVNGEWWRSWHNHVTDQIGVNAWSPSYAKTIFDTARWFVSWLYEEAELLDALPRNLSKLRVKAETKEVRIYSVEQIREYLATAEDRTKLYILLTLNCGMTAIDMADLLPSEVDFRAGTITRRRSKTRESSGKVPTVCYRLWTPTRDSLKKAADESAATASKRGIADPPLLLTNRGGRLATRAVQGSARNDSIRLAFKRLKDKLGTSGPFLSLKKTSASLIDEEFGHDVAQLFLGHAPSTIAGKNYVKVASGKLDKALAWLGEQYGVA